jgi:RimJ/RimL family protein N-acetyltransferase
MASSDVQHDLPAGEGNVLKTERLTLREVLAEEVFAILDGRTLEGAVWAEG